MALVLATGTTFLTGCLKNEGNPVDNQSTKSGAPEKMDRISSKADFNTLSKDMTPEQIEKIKPGYIASHQNPKISPLAKSAGSGVVGFSNASLTTCPEGLVWFLMDDENNGNDSRMEQRVGSQTVWYVASTTGAVESPNDPNGFGKDTKLKYCRVSRSNLYSAGQDYVVLRLSASCPTGGYPFARIKDNQDNDGALLNHNSNSGNISPSTQGDGTTGHGWTRLEMCFVPKQTNYPPTGGFPYLWSPYESGYGTLPPSLGAHVAQGQADLGTNSSYPYSTSGARGHSDDEDNYNANGWEWYGMSSAYQARVTAIMRETPNTTYYEIRHAPF